MQVDEVNIWQDLGVELKRAEKRLRNEMLEIANLLSEVAAVTSPKKLEAYLTKDLELFGSDAPSIVRLAKLPADERKRLRKTSIPVATLRTYVGQSQVVRADIIGRIEAGTPITSRDITTLARERRTTPAERERKRRDAYLRKASHRFADAEIKRFREKFAPFAEALLDLHIRCFDEEFGEWPDKEMVDAELDQLTASALNALPAFERAFDTADLPQIWDTDIYTGETDDARLARAYSALKDMSKGIFEPWDFNCEDPRPAGVSAGLIDEYYVDAILWLCGLEYPSVTKTNKQKSAVTVDLENPAKRLSSIELCAGAGGAALGLHAAGFDAMALYEFDKDAVSTLRSNDWLGDIYHKDITNVDFSRFRDLDVDLVTGGLPCQPYSASGKKEGREDERDLFSMSVDIVSQVMPRAIFFENVEGFKFQKQTDYRAELHAKFAALGYECRLFTIKGFDFGLPQKRKRVAFVGFRDGSMNRFKLPKTMPNMATNLGQAIGDLVAENGWPYASEWAKNADRLFPTITGGSKKSSSTGFTTHYRKEELERMQIDPTKIAKHAPSSKHPQNALFPLTHAMAARIQGFPDDWKFAGGRVSQKRQIGNALPPVMARVVGLAIYGALRGIEIDFETELKKPMMRSTNNAQWRKTLKLNNNIGMRRHHSSMSHHYSEEEGRFKYQAPDPITNIRKSDYESLSDTPAKTNATPFDWRRSGQWIRSAPNKGVSKEAVAEHKDG